MTRNSAVSRLSIIGFTALAVAGWMSAAKPTDRLGSLSLADLDTTSGADRHTFLNSLSSCDENLTPTPPLVGTYGCTVQNSGNTNCIACTNAADPTDMKVYTDPDNVATPGIQFGETVPCGKNAVGACTIVNNQPKCAQYTPGDTFCDNVTQYWNQAAPGGGGD